MASRSLDDLDPRVQPTARAVVKAWKDKGFEGLITCTYRSNEEQEVLYSKGRGGVPGPRVTYARAGQSFHNHGLAIDFVPVVNGKLLWDSDSPLWGILARIAMEVDPTIEWGGYWSPRKRDLPHIQFRIHESGTPSDLAGGTLPPPNAPHWEKA